MAVRASLLTVALLLGSLSLAAAVQVTDFLPLLPHPYNLQALQSTSLGDPISILPKYVGSLIPGKEVAWNGSCFKSTKAYINLTEPVKDGSLGGGVVHVIVSVYPEVVIFLWSCLKVLCVLERQTRKAK